MTCINCIDTQNQNLYGDIPASIGNLNSLETLRLRNNQLTGNIPESIDVDIENLNLGDSIRLTEISLPEGSEIPGLTDETDQMVVSINAPKAVEEDPIVEEDLEEGKDQDGDGDSDFADVQMARMKASGMSDEEAKEKV